MYLHDTTIAQIVNLIQMALLTGTDIVDHLRMLMLEIDSENKLIVDKEYKKIFEESVQKMLENVNTNLDRESEEKIVP